MTQAIGSGSADAHSSAATDTAAPAAPSAGEGRGTGNSGSSASSGAAGAGPGQTPHWSATIAQGLPAALLDHLKELQSPEEAAQALKRGIGYRPAEKPEDIRLTFPEGVRVDEGVQKSFADFCVHESLTPLQAQKLLDFQTRMDGELRREHQSRGEDALRAKWGPRLEENRAKALTMFTNIDRHMEGRLAQSFGGREMAASPDMVEALHYISTLISEDVIGGGQAWASGSDRPQTTEEFYREKFAKRGA